jgi:hypothetical protein
MGNNKRVRYVFSALVLTMASLCLLLLATHNDVWGQTTSTALDPGPRVGGITTGNPLATFTPVQLLYFQDGLIRFLAVDSVNGTAPGETDLGLGPGYNSTVVPVVTLSLLPGDPARLPTHSSSPPMIMERRTSFGLSSPLMGRYARLVSL